MKIDIVGERSPYAQLAPLGEVWQRRTSSKSWWSVPEDLDQQSLQALSLAERTVLGLLAQGHTAKSIAVSTGTTESAVNERLREARRKTGASSSRELARALAQEAWSQNFGIEPPAADKPPAVEDVGRPGRRWGVLLMLAALTAAVALAMVSHTGRQSAPADAMTDHFATLNPPSLAALRRQLINEGRDFVWTSSTEAAVRERIQKVMASGRYTE